MDFAEVMSSKRKLKIRCPLLWVQDFLVLAEYQVLVFLVARSWLNQDDFRKPCRNTEKIVSVMWPPE